MTALYDMVNTEIHENLFDAVSGSDSDKTVFLFRCSNGFFGSRCVTQRKLFRMLFPHIFDFDGGQRAVFQAFFQNLPRVIGMNMNLDDFIVGNQHEAVTACIQK